jgi:hypothetical protein
MRLPDLLLPKPKVAGSRPVVRSDRESHGNRVCSPFSLGSAASGLFGVRVRSVLNGRVHGPAGYISATARALEDLSLWLADRNTR